MPENTHTSGPVNGWPPAEPIVPAAVVARLDHFGWTAEHTTLLEHTDRHALARYGDGVNPALFVVVDLVDGHRLGDYGTEPSARTAFDAVKRGGEPDA